MRDQAEPSKVLPVRSSEADLRRAAQLASSGKVREAIALYESHIAEQPNDALVLNNLGVLCRRIGDSERGLSCLRRASEISPNNADLAYNLANALSERGGRDEAAELYQKAIKLNPIYVAAYVNLAHMLQSAKKDEEAANWLKRGVAVAPNSAALHFQLGSQLWQRGKDTAALAHYRIAASLDPADANTKHNIAAALLRLDRYEEALTAAEETIAGGSASAETFAIEGQALVALGRLDKGEEALRRALALDVENLSAQLGLARALLLAGRFAEGWSVYGARWRRSKTVLPKFDSPAWDGSDPRGKRIAVVTEQGFGDSIQFARYAPLLAERCASVQIVCEPPLLRLFGGLPGIERVVVKTESGPGYDAYVPMLELPRLFGTTLATVPASIPYLASKGSARRDGPPTIGLVWAGSPGHENDRNRSIPLEAFVPILGRPGVRFVSLQFGPGAADLTRVGVDSLVTDLIPRIRDFADSAALMSQIDLVISADTAPAHLAGAIGRPVWTLLPYAPDWRWMLDRDDTPWYPTMRLFRQPAPGDWASVMCRVDEQLTRYLATRMPAR
jgi:tetratricopeptide (TPR) repeat protein